MVDLTQEQQERIGHLRRLSRDGGPLAPGAPDATVNNPRWFVPGLGGADLVPTPERDMLHRDILEQFYDKQGRGDRAQRSIMLAGPPGAGKGTIRDQVTSEIGQQFTIVDPDEFKTLLMENAHDRGWLDDLIPDEVRQSGFTITPMEMAALVHEESSYLAQQVRDTALAAGENVVIDSVMARESAALQNARDLERHGYAIEVVSVQVPQELSQARILQRWAKDSATSLGGRWVPSEYRHDVFAGDHKAASWPDRNARTVAEQVGAVERYRRYFTTMEMAAAAQPARLTHDLRRGADGRLRGQTKPASRDPAFPSLPNPQQAPHLPSSRRPPSPEPPTRGRGRGR